MKQGKGHTFAAMISQSFQSVWMEFGVLLRLVGVMNLILVSCLFNIQGREPSMCDFVKKKKKFGLYSDIYRLISFKFDLMIGTTKRNILISIWMTMTFIQGQDCLINQKLWCQFP